MDRSKIRERLASLKQKGPVKKVDTSDILKLENGETTVRIVPLKSNPDYPFFETYWHYNLNRRSLLSPHTYGETDPILEFSIDSQDRANGKEEWKAAKQLEPKLRIYTPVLVRGKESEGVKLWSFGINLYEELLAYMDDEDYGDISDLENGTDITITKKSPEEAGNTYGETTIRMKRNATPVAKKSELDDILEIISNQPDISEMEYFQAATAEELEKELKKFLNTSDSDSDSAPAQVTRTKAEPTETAETVPSTETDNPTVKKKFNDIFNKK